MRKPLVVLAVPLMLTAFAAVFAAEEAPSSTAAAAPEQPRFLLLIHGGEEPPAAEREAVVDAYRQWARRLAAEGRLVGADELAEEAVLLSAGEAGGVERTSREPSAGGYFLISAPDIDAALAIARDCPALARGGAVEVVAIRRN